MTIHVVATGKIGLPPVVPFPTNGHVHVVTGQLVKTGTEPFPSEAYPSEKLKDVTFLRLPSIAVGGHYAPRHPRLYQHKHRGATVSTRETNWRMADNSVRRLADGYGDRDRATAILGGTSRGGMEQTAFVCILPVVSALEYSAHTLVHHLLFRGVMLLPLGRSLHPLSGAAMRADHSVPASDLVSDIQMMMIAGGAHGNMD